MRNKRREARGAEARAPDTEPFPELQTAAAASLCGTQVPTVAPARMCITEPHHEAEDPPWRHRARAEPDADAARAQGSSGTGRGRLCRGRREREGDIGAGPRRGERAREPEGGARRRDVRGGQTTPSVRTREPDVGRAQKGPEDTLGGAMAAITQTPNRSSRKLRGHQAEQTPEGTHRGTSRSNDRHSPMTAKSWEKPKANGALPAEESGWECARPLGSRAGGKGTRRRDTLEFCALWSHPREGRRDRLSQQTRT